MKRSKARWSRRVFDGWSRVAFSRDLRCCQNMIESSRWTGVPHDLCDFALTSWADQTMLVLIPLMVALMTIHHFSRSRSVQVPISAARSWRMVCHGVSNALIGGEGSQSETQCQTGISNRSERQYDRLLGYAGGNICLRCSNDPAGLEDRG